MGSINSSGRCRQRQFTGGRSNNYEYLDFENGTSTIKLDKTISYEIFHLGIPSHHCHSRLYYPGC